MTPDDLVHSNGAWLQGTGPQAEIVISSRVRLARNLAKTPFTPRAKKDTLAEVLQQVQAAAGEVPAFRDGMIVRMSDLDEVDRQLLVERRLMSREHAVHPEHKAVAVGKDE